MNEPGRNPTRERVAATLARRYRREWRFRAYGVTAIALALGFLGVFFHNIIGTGYSAFLQTHVELDVYLDPELLSRDGVVDAESLYAADYATIVRRSIGALFPQVTSPRERRELARLMSPGAEFHLHELLRKRPGLVGERLTLSLLADDDVDMLIKGHIDRDRPEAERRLSDRQIGWVDALAADGRIEHRFNVLFFTSGDSREPELAGILGAAMGSFYMLLITVLLAFPLGVATAIYLEEFAPRGRWTDLIEVNINNLAAVPSIIYGLLGLAIFINLVGLPRSAPLVGALVLTLMTLPVIIIAGRAAIKAVPPSIRDAALGLGASRTQMVFSHVLPLAMPGMLTGTIIGMARALGESAPLLMIGMVAFIVDVPDSPMGPATALPVQVFLWADAPERAFIERTAAAIMVLLAFLLAMNALAVYLRRRFERRW